VVLSACQTALGRELRGEGLLGLSRSFMYAGAPRVVASLWRVSDSATTELMTAFYEELLRNRVPAAEALGRARLRLMRNPLRSSPYYWAGFTLQGDWR
jgi:CHAT domain-containing protein